MTTSDSLQTVAGLHGLILAWESDQGPLQAPYDYAVDVGGTTQIAATVHSDSDADGLLELSAFVGIEATLNGEIIAPMEGRLEPYGNSWPIRIRQGENRLKLTIDPARVNPRVSARICAPDRSPLTCVARVSPAWEAAPEEIRADLPSATDVSSWHYWNGLANRRPALRLGEGPPAAWREALRERIIELLGSIAPAPTTVETVGSEQLPGLRRDRLWFTSEAGWSFPAWSLVPDDPNGAGILCIHGHGYVHGETVGRDGGDPKQAKALADHNYAYGLRLAERGYTVIAPDMRGFGPRLDDETFRRDACDTVYIRLAQFGVPLLALQLQDLTTALDHLLTSDAVDPNRVGATGLSYGGRLTMYISALDDRIACAVASGCLNTFRERLTIDSSCGAQFVPGLLEHADTPDVFGLIAPRPLLLELGTNDGTSPEIFATEAYSEIERVYGAAEAPERLDIDIFETGHRYNGAKAFDWFERWLVPE